jgi:hypothetical protein
MRPGRSPPGMAISSIQRRGSGEDRSADQDAASAPDQPLSLDLG